MSTLYKNYWWSVLYFFSPILITMCLLWGWHVLIMLYDIIISRTFYIVPSCHMSMWPMWQWQWLMWTLSHAYVICDIMFCLLCLCPNKEKEVPNKIKNNKKKKKKIKPSSSFTTLTLNPIYFIPVFLKFEHHWTCKEIWLFCTISNTKPCYKVLERIECTAV